MKDKKMSKEILKLKVFGLLIFCEEDGFFVVILVEGKFVFGFCDEDFIVGIFYDIIGSLKMDGEIIEYQFWVNVVFVEGIKLCD